MHMHTCTVQFTYILLHIHHVCVHMCVVHVCAHTSVEYIIYTDVASHIHNIAPCRGRRFFGGALPVPAPLSC